mmetsp:Transcript_2834/g.9532  ORF Transcript_2834/g.9532 Transcript_2834/m.9532 type:complete len:680 (+) Transcript_2834:431-2470(+)
MATTTNESNKHHARVLALAEAEDDGGESDRPIAEEYSELVVAVRANRAAEAARLADMRRDGSVGGGARRGDDGTGVTGGDGGGGGGGGDGEDFAVVAAEDDDDAKAFLALVTPPGSVVKAPTSLPTSASGLPETTPGGTVKPRPANQSRENRRVRQFRSASEITQEELASCFHLPSEAACRKLGIGLTVLKRQCRKFGIKRWPFRKMKSLDRLITNVQAGISPGDQNKLLVKSVEELEEQKRRMEECQVLDLDDTTKRLQQAYSKANHKARRNRSEASKIRAAASSMAIRELEARGRKKKSPTNQDAYGLLSLAGVLSGGGEYGDEEIMDDDDEQSGSRGGASGVSSGVKRDEHGVEMKQEINTNALPSNIVGAVGAVDATILAAKSPLGNKTKESVASDKKPARGSAGASASKTSNAMVNRGTYYANTEEFEVEEKVLTAVKGAWSPARPAARKSDAEDTVEAFLSPVNKRKAPVGRPSKADADTKRAKPYAGAKRGRKKKNASEDDDPLASLAAAALGLKAPSTRGVGRPRKNPLIAPKAASVGGAGASTKDSKESSARDAAPTTTTKDTAASSAAVDAAAATTATATTSAKDVDDTSEDHPAFAVPVVKGARTARSRLNPVDHSYYKRHIEERMAELREMLVSRRSDTGGVDLDIRAETSKLVEELETLNAPTSKR